MSNLKTSLKKKFEDFKEGFFTGMGWSFGATVGFAIVYSILVLLISKVGGVPLIGHWIASIVEATQTSLTTKGL